MMNVLTMLAAAALQPATSPASCTLDEEAKRANAALSFDEFDQRGTLPSSGRKLGEAGCWRQAAEAWADYLIRGPAPTPGQQRTMLFHLGQALAMAGEERRAADFVAATRMPADAVAQTELNWNDYVRGTWAFLVKDRPMLIAARDAVLAGAGRGNANNGALLAGMERCFDRPYVIAYSTNCGR